MSPPKSSSSLKSKASVPKLIVPTKTTEDVADRRSPPPGPPPPQLKAKWLKDNGIPVYNQRLSKSSAKKTTTTSSNQDSQDSESEISPPPATVTTSKGTNVTARLLKSYLQNKLLMVNSNVLPSELKKYLKWLFRSDLQSLSASTAAEPVSTSCDQLIGAMRMFFFFKDQGQWKRRGHNDDKPMIYLPSEWQSKLPPIKNQNPFSEEFKQRIVVDFFSLYDPQNTLVKWKPGKEIKAFTFSDPNIFNMENPYIKQGAVAYALAHFLQVPAFNPFSVGELEVERLIGSSLTGFFNVPGCVTTSNRPVTFPEEMTCFGSHPRPDYATRINEQINHLKDTIYPVVNIGEGKSKFILSKKNESGGESQTQLLQLPQPNSMRHNMEWSPRMAAQLAFAAYPSLCVIIASLITKWKSSPLKKKPKREDYQIPDYAVIYGIGYAATGVLIYAFFPYVREWDATSNFPKKWGFVSVLVTSAFREVFSSENLQDRLHLAQVLLLIQQHAKRLKDIMKSAAFPEEFRA